MSSGEIPRREPIVLPPRSDSQDRDAYEDVARLARLMDSILEIPILRIRLGLDALLGLLPGVGDTLTAVVSLYILQTASAAGVPRVTLARMTLNILLDVLLGSLPLVGDLFDVAWKANNKNVALLEKHLASTPEAARRARRSDWLFVAMAVVVVGLAVLGAAVASIWLLSVFVRAVGRLF